MRISQQRWHSAVKVGVAGTNMALNLLFYNPMFCPAYREDDISDALPNMDIIVLTGTKQRAVEHGVCQRRSINHTVVRWGFRKTRWMTNACGGTILYKPYYVLRKIYKPPAGIAGRAGALRLWTGTTNILAIWIYGLQRGIDLLIRREFWVKLKRWINSILDAIGRSTLTFFGGDLNEEFGLFIDDMSQWCLNASRSLGKQNRGLQTPVGDDMVWLDGATEDGISYNGPSNQAYLCGRLDR